MVNLFEQWNDMDFASTYEPIDWKALNDFANRARQDAKDNADLLKDKMSEFDTIYEDPNSEKVAAKTAKLNEVRSQIQNINLNDSPAMVSAQLSKYRNPLATDATNFKNFGTIRFKNVGATGISDPDLQIMDRKYSNGIEDNSPTYQAYADYQTNLTNARQRIEADKASASYAGDTRENAAITQSKVMTLAAGETSDLKIGKRQAMDHRLANIGRLGDKSEWWNRYKDYIELDRNGRPVLDERGSAIVKSDFTGDASILGGALFKHKVTPNGVALEKDENGNRIRIDIGRGYDALVNQELYRDLMGIANEKQDASSARPTKGKGNGLEINDDRTHNMTWYQRAMYLSDRGRGEFKDGVYIPSNVNIPMSKYTAEAGGYSNEDWDKMMPIEKLSENVHNAPTMSDKVEDVIDFLDNEESRSVSIPADFKDYQEVGDVVLKKDSESGGIAIEKYGVTFKDGQGIVKTLHSGDKYQYIPQGFIAISEGQERLAPQKTARSYIYVCGANDQRNHRGYDNPTDTEQNPFDVSYHLLKELITNKKLDGKTIVDGTASVCSAADGTGGSPVSINMTSVVSVDDINQAVKSLQERGVNVSRWISYDGNKKKLRINPEVCDILGIPTENIKGGRGKTMKTTSDSDGNRYITLSFKRPIEGTGYTRVMIDQVARGRVKTQSDTSTATNAVDTTTETSDGAVNGSQG